MKSSLLTCVVLALGFWCIVLPAEYVQAQDVSIGPLLSSARHVMSKLSDGAIAVNPEIGVRIKTPTKTADGVFASSAQVQIASAMRAVVVTKNDALDCKAASSPGEPVMLSPCSLKAGVDHYVSFTRPTVDGPQAVVYVDIASRGSHKYMPIDAQQRELRLELRGGEWVVVYDKIVATN
jgi:hypothetical protein